MKKFLLILLTVLLGLSCFACVDNESNQNCSPMRVKTDTFIQDSAGVDKCLWEDGQAVFYDDPWSCPKEQKHAELTVQTEYDMWYGLPGISLEFEEDYRSIEFEYDETKIEIKANPDKDNHFILKILQPCDQETVISKITKRYTVYNKDGKPLREDRFTESIPITVTATE